VTIMSLTILHGPDYPCAALTVKPTPDCSDTFTNTGVSQPQHNKRENNHGYQKRP
jgi:hypothetical protein